MRAAVAQLIVIHELEPQWCLPNENAAQHGCRHYITSEMETFHTSADNKPEISLLFSSKKNFKSWPLR